MSEERVERRLAAIMAAAGPLQTAPAREVARDAGAERPQEPAVRLSCRDQQQLPRQPDEKGMRADQRS